MKWRSLVYSHSPALYIVCWMLSKVWKTYIICKGKIYSNHIMSDVMRDLLCEEGDCARSGVCAGDDLVTELVWSRLVGLRWGLCTGLSSADYQSVKAEIRFCLFSLSFIMSLLDWEWENEGLVACFCLKFKCVVFPRCHFVLYLSCNFKMVALKKHFLTSW